MNCGSLFLSAGGGTMEASHPDIVYRRKVRYRKLRQGSGKGMSSRSNLLAHLILQEAALRSSSEEQL
jgi:hypothetical protein